MRINWQHGSSSSVVQFLPRVLKCFLLCFLQDTLSDTVKGGPVKAMKRTVSYSMAIMTVFYMVSFEEDAATVPHTCWQSHSFFPYTKPPKSTAHYWFTLPKFQVVAITGYMAYGKLEHCMSLAGVHVSCAFMQSNESSVV